MHFSVRDAVTELTVKVKDFVWDTGPAVPVIVMEYGPPGVDVEGDNVNVVLQTGVQDDAENEDDVPEGTPEAVKATG